MLAPLALCGAKIISGCYSLYQYKAKGKIRNENSPVKAVWTTIGICWLLAYLPFITGFVLPLSVGIIILIIMSLGICGFSYIYHFSLYRPMYQVLLGQKFSAINVSIKQITNDTYLKSISSDASITSKKKDMLISMNYLLNVIKNYYGVVLKELLYLHLTINCSNYSIAFFSKYTSSNE